MSIKSIDDLRALDGRRAPLTPSEWLELLDVVQHEELAAHLRSVWGLILEVALYEPPTYPGLPAERVCAIRQDALVGGASGSNFEAAWGAKGSDFDKAWCILQPITHASRNRELLRFCGLPEPRPKSHYKY